MRRFVQLLLAGVVAAVCSWEFAIAEPAGETIMRRSIGIGDARAVFLLPDDPTESVILMPDGDGRLKVGYDGRIGRLREEELVRTRFVYAAHGVAVLVADAGINLRLAVNAMRRVKSPVTVIATGLGTVRAAQGIVDGARPDALVLISGILTNASGSRKNVASVLRNPARLPHTLVIHHLHDDCALSRPAGVEPFIKWAGGRARVVWLTGGSEAGLPCDAQSHHGFSGIDDRVLSLALDFH